MNTLKTIFRNDFIKLFLAALLGGVFTWGAAAVFSPDVNIDDGLSISERQERLAQPTLLTANLDAGSMPDFRAAANKSVQGVVHIRSKVEEQPQTNSPNPFEEFFGMPFGPRRGPAEASGSGVILTDNGYIVTNNHVIAEASEVSVTLWDNREYTADVIGTDPSTDLALIKINEQDLPFIAFGNSDKLQVGEWVLAVGNPFNLTSTVTAGIVSAKSRPIGILEDRYSIESFIQTDAAVNPGNSGGALVNQNGELIGVNTAIASRTGSYVGYSFAVPVDIVRKVVDDLKEFGEVQRGLLGVQIISLDSKLKEAKELNTDLNNGVYIDAVGEESAAKDAGLETGDIIVAVDDVETPRSSKLQEVVARKRPGDQVKITYYRDGEKRETTATLRSREGTTAPMLARADEDVRELGANFMIPEKDVLDELDLKYGVQVRSLMPGKLRSAGVREGFIITKIDRKPMRSIKDIEKALDAVPEGGVLIEGYYPNGKRAYYAVGS